MGAWVRFALVAALSTVTVDALAQAGGEGGVGGSGAGGATGGAGGESANLDEDGDGYSIAEGDCDDTDRDSYPGAYEYCDGFDNDCDGSVDDEQSCNPNYDSGPTPPANMVSGVLLGAWMAVGTWRRRRKLPR